MMEEEFEVYVTSLLDLIRVLSNIVCYTLDTHDARGNSDKIWTLLGMTKTTEHHERILGNGYLIQAIILLAR